MELTAYDAKRVSDYIANHLDKKGDKDRQLGLKTKVCIIRFRESENEINIHLSFRDKTDKELREGVPNSKEINEG